MYQVNYENCTNLKEFFKESMSQLADGYVEEYPTYLLKIQDYMKQCESYRELGTNQGASASAVMLTNPKYVELIDKSFSRFNPSKHLFDQYANDNNIGFMLHEESSVSVKTDIKTDFLLVDSVHKYKHVKKEIELYEPLTTKFILFHDTVGFPGVGKAVQEFVNSNKDWELHFHLDHPQAGYTVTKRTT